MRRLIPLLIATSLLCACAFSVMEKGLNSITGQHVDVAIDALGLPSGEMNIAGRRVLVWSTQRNMVLPQTTSSNTTGTFGTTPDRSATTYSGYSTTRLSCEIKMTIDTSDRIQTWEFEGNQGACQTYADRLKHVIPKG